MERLIKEYDEIIEKFSRKIYRSHYLYAIGVLEDDVIQIGRIALCKAIERFDEDRGVQFTTFAYEVVKNRIEEKMSFLEENRARHGYNSKFKMYSNSWFVSMN